MKQSDAPVEERRIKIGERHPAEIVMRPTKRVREDCLIVDLRDCRMARAVPRAREFAPPNRSPQLPGQHDRRCRDSYRNCQQSALFKWDLQGWLGTVV